MLLEVEDIKSEIDDTITKLQNEAIGAKEEFKKLVSQCAGWIPIVLLLILVTIMAWIMVVVDMIYHQQQFVNIHTCQLLTD